MVKVTVKTTITWSFNVFINCLFGVKKVSLVM